jgi:tyrosyl-tRNA synthetase
MEDTKLSVERRIQIIESIGIECIGKEDLKKLLETKERPIAYDGFEPSGIMHIGQALVRASNIKKLQKAGVKMVIWIADWFAKLNKKFGGDLQKIKTVGNFFIEIWKACGVDTTTVEFIWASDYIKENAQRYMEIMLDIGLTFNVTDGMHCCTIMGRKEGESMSISQLNYVQMQCADVFFIKGGVDICQMGLDQRKVNMFAREYYDHMKKQKDPPEWYKSRICSPVIISHKMIMSLEGPGEKMSKSKPETAIFIDDNPDDIKRKINKAFCPPKQVFALNSNEIINPIIEYFKLIVIPYCPIIEIVDKNYDFDSLVKAYESNIIGPKEIKISLAKYINELLVPIRKHFESGDMKKLADEVHSYKITR